MALQRRLRFRGKDDLTLAWRAAMRGDMRGDGTHAGDGGLGYNGVVVSAGRKILRWHGGDRGGGMCEVMAHILVANTQEQEEEAARILAEHKARKEKKEVVKQTKKLALLQEQAAKRKQLEEEMEKLKKEEEEKMKAVYEEEEEEKKAEEEEPLIRRTTRERGESSGTRKEDPWIEKVSEWVANLSLGETEEAMLYVPREEQEAVIKEIEVEADPLKRQTIEEDKQSEWKLRLTREKKKRIEELARWRKSTEMKARLENTERLCTGGAKLAAPKEEEFRPRREPVKKKFPYPYSGKREENFDNWEANVNSYLRLQKISPEEHVLIAFHALRDEAASFARSLYRAAKCDDDMVAVIHNMGEVFELHLGNIMPDWLPGVVGWSEEDIEALLKDFMCLLERTLLSSGEDSMPRLKKISINGALGFGQDLSFFRVLLSFLQQSSCHVQELTVKGAVGLDDTRRLELLGNGLPHYRSLSKLQVGEFKTELPDDIATTLAEGVVANASLWKCSIDCRLPKNAIMVLAKGLASANERFCHIATACPGTSRLLAADENGASGSSLEIENALVPGSGRQAQSRPRLGVLFIIPIAIDKEQAEALAEMLNTNNSLRVLRLWATFDTEEFITLQKGLRANTCLECLIVTYCLPFWNANERAEILSTLNYNKTLRKFDFTVLSDPIIIDKLNQNKREWELLQAVGASQYTASKHIRCFLAGDPYAGKSTLRDSFSSGIFWSGIKTMMRTMPIVPTEAMPRTKGIEVVQMEKEGVHIQLWDLGGQTEYHSIHDLLMPTLGGDRAAPNIFLLMCNPVMPSEMRKPAGFSTNTLATKGKQHAIGWKDQLESRLRYWLRFIAANCSPARQPCVILVFNPHHPHKLDRTALSIRVRELLHWMSTEFRGLLEISTEEFMIDAREWTGATRVKDFLFIKASELLQKTNVLEVMERAHSQIINFRESVGKDVPLISWSQFHTVCPFGNLEANATQQGPATADQGSTLIENGSDGSDLWELTAHYLHDIGQVIWFDPMPFVVLSPHWFCCKIVGEIIPTEFYSSGVHDGVAKEDLMKRVLGRALPPTLEASLQNLIDLMVRMKIAYKISDTSLMIPACLPERQEGEGLHWESMPSGSEQLQGNYFGFRIACKDKDRLMLTAGFFHRLQVHLHQKFHSMGRYRCEKDLAWILFNGHEIFIEFGGIHDDWIDVMVFVEFGAMQRKRHPVDWVDENVLHSITELCHEPTGLPGVHLVIKILRPGCLKAHKILPRRYRDDRQTVTEEELLERIECEGSDYMHSWEAVCGAQGEEIIRASSDLAIELIRPRVLKYRPLSRKMEVGGTGTVSQGFRGSLQPSGEPSHATNCTVPKGENLVEIIEQGLESVIETVKENTRRVLERQDKLSNFVIEQHTHRLPHLLYVTEKKSSGLRKKMLFFIGLRTVELHLMCEYRGGIHFVDGQRGKKTRFEIDERRHFWTFFKWTLITLSVLVKAGFAVTSGVFQLVPDMADAANWTTFVIGELGTAAMDDLVDPEDLQRRMNAPEKDAFVGGSADDGIQRQQAVAWLDGILKGGDRREIRELFDLMQVRYRDTDSVAWICKSCWIKNRIALELL
ncbi:hypothetical protein CBR_g40961 [Chara braunii]|uniref:Uncharacterized protein n=1 Tax=Chara braunii TaxID=69332 RepID=A0A388LUQ9_CHABU|nr:hypothetical protein CBR_g40961 [Chara braunii]|eukprot:GBG86060.1 hypothetical protein CBR_g40961 [Chara braunii]